MNADRDPTSDPQAGDCFLVHFPCGGAVAVHVVHRRAEWVWFAGAHIPIRSSRVDHFVHTLVMGRAECMNALDEERRWPTPRLDPSHLLHPAPPES